MIRRICAFLLAATLMLVFCPALKAERDEDQVVTFEAESGTRGAGEQPMTRSDTDDAGGVSAIQPPSGPTDAELRSERPRRSWLPTEETELGMPQSATGGGFPDRSTRTGTFGRDTEVPGAGGTRAGR